MHIISSSTILIPLPYTDNLAYSQICPTHFCAIHYAEAGGAVSRTAVGKNVPRCAEVQSFVDAAVPARVHDYLDLAGCTYDTHPRVLAEHERRGQSTVFFRTAWDGSPWSDYSTPNIYGVTLHSRFKERE